MLDRNVLERLQWRYIIVDEGQIHNVIYQSFKNIFENNISSILVLIGHRLKNFQCRLVQYYLFL